MSFVSGAKRRLAQARERRPFLDHVLRTVDHYGNVKSPAVERARGTLVRPTPAPIPVPPVGTVELAE